MRASDAADNAIMSGAIGDVRVKVLLVSALADCSKGAITAREQS